MAFNEQTANRVRSVLAEELAGHPVSITDKHMFGGLAVMINGNMCCGVVGQNLVIRVSANQYEQALAQPHARPMDFTGRPMRGFVYVSPAGIRSDTQLRTWIRWSLELVLSLPPK